MRPIVKTININFRLHCPCVLFSNCATRTPQGGKTLPSFILTSKSTAPKFSAEEEEELGRYFLGSEKPRWDEKEEESGERQGGGGASYVINCRPGRTCQQIIPFDEEEEEDERDNEVEEKEEEEEERWREERPKRKGFSDRVDYAFGGGGRSWEDDDSDEFYSSRQVTKIINLHQIVRYLINCFCSWRDGGSWENAVESDQEVSSALEQRIKERNRIREREKPQAFSSNSYYGQKRPFRPRPPPQSTTSYSTNRPYHYSRWPTFPVTSAPFHFQVRIFFAHATYFALSVTIHRNYYFLQFQQPTRAPWRQPSKFPSASKQKSNYDPFAFHRDKKPKNKLNRLRQRQQEKRRQQQQQQQQQQQRWQQQSQRRMGVQSPDFLVLFFKKM